MCKQLQAHEYITITRLAAYVQSVSSTGASPAAWFRRLEVMFDMNDMDESEELERFLISDHVHTILIHAVQLQELTFGRFLVSNTTLAILRLSCARTLTKLDISFDFSSPGPSLLRLEISQIQAFQNLRKLALRMSDATAISPDNHIAGWYLPHVTHLTWDQFHDTPKQRMSRLVAEVPPSVIAFLARCSFPSLLSRGGRGS
jgi:hypothetical protein